MKNEDFSFLTADVGTEEAEQALPLVSMSQNASAVITPAVVIRTPDKPAEMAPDTLVSWVPRTHYDWSQHLEKLKLERAAAWATYDKHRGLNLQAYELSASPAEIAAAKAELQKIRAQIRLAKKRLSSWWWYPFLKWPPLSCHIVNSNDIASNSIRFWRSAAKDRYMKHLISSLEEDEAFKVALSKAITTDAANKKGLANRPFWDTKQKFEAAEAALKKAIDEFTAFKKNGPRKETPTEEAARRIAGYTRDCRGTTIISSSCSTVNQTGHGSLTQTNRPSEKG